MSGNTLIIVESPAKAKTINKYLGDGYRVVASYGHIRDLPSRDGSVRPDEDFAMDWELGDRAKKHVDEITKAAREADRILLATDPDREGEAISWHVREVLLSRRGLGKADIRRVTFNEVTRNAVLDAIAQPRPLNDELIEAYLARRALDYLVGFTLSPVLWRKLPGSKSAGRVQSVALRLISEREAEIERFRPQEYWTIEGLFATPSGDAFRARLTHFDGTKLDKFAIPTGEDANRIVARLADLTYGVRSIERKQVRRRPVAPFTTSTLQQEASRKLGFSATQTMMLAQRLYEGIDLGGETVGLITYMRTDGLQLADEAVAATRSLIDADFGGDYLPSSPIRYKSTAKNAQEAHEAIRPTDPGRRPPSLRRSLDGDLFRLYELIWKRTVACQMANAVIDQVAVDVASGDGSAVLRATGSVIRFDGFLKVYEEGRDDSASDEDAEARLPNLTEGTALTRTETTPRQHFTQPPPRYTEASLVKRMEELGIGRPSTYASILQVLQDREYVRLDRKRFVPEDRGRLVTAFLTNFFRRYVEYDFTANLEEQLDDISGGRIDWKAVLRDFWEAFSRAVADTKDLTISQVIEAIDNALGPHFFRPRADGRDPRACPSCADGRLGLKLSRSGAFIGCSNYPDCRYTRPLEVPGEGDDDGDRPSLPRDLGVDPETGEVVSLRNGPFGIYVQLGDGANGKAKPKRVSLPKGYIAAEVDLDRARRLLALPREVGVHPDSREPITAGVGRYGPYLKHGTTYQNLPADEDVLTVGINRAVELLATAKPGRAAAEPLRALGAHPQTGEPVGIFKGRFGPYIKHRREHASVPKSADAETLGLEEAVAILAAKAATKGKGSKAGKKAPAKAAAAESADDAKTASAPAANRRTAAKATGKTGRSKSASAGKSRKATRSTG